MIMWIIICQRAEGRPLVQTQGSGNAVPTIRDSSPELSTSSMTTLPTPSQIASLDDERLEELAKGWRTQALRGDRRAYGVAHAFEVERRRRLRESEFQPLVILEEIPRSKPWWKFW